MRVVEAFIVRPYLTVFSACFDIRTQLHKAHRRIAGFDLRPADDSESYQVGGGIG